MQCPSGFFSNNENSNDRCSECPAGKSSRVRASTCANCLKGQYSSTAKSSNCKLCTKLQIHQDSESGKTYSTNYQDQTGKTKCKTCPNGQISLETLCSPASANSLAPTQTPEYATVRMNTDDNTGSTVKFQFQWDRTYLNKPTRFVLAYLFDVRGCITFNENDIGNRESKTDNREEPTFVRTDVIDWTAVTSKDQDFEFEVKLPIPAWCGLYYTKRNFAQVFAEYGDYTSPFSRKGPRISFPSWGGAHLCTEDHYFEVHDPNPLYWECKKCPLGTFCQGPLVFNTVRAKFGWYRVVQYQKVENVLEQKEPGVQANEQNKRRRIDVDFTNTTFVECKHPSACLGAPNHKYNGVYVNQNDLDPSKIMNNTESCSYNDGYKMFCDGRNDLLNNVSVIEEEIVTQNIDGTTTITVVHHQRHICRLCATCKFGYRRSSAGTYQCFKCQESETLETFLLFVGSIGLLLAIVGLVLNTMSDAGNDLASDALQKIFVNYLQAAALALSFPLKWPKMVKDLLVLQGAISTVGEFFINPDCQLDDLSASELFYSKAIAYATIPFVISLACALFWYVLGAFYYKTTWSAPRSIDGKSRRDPHTTYPVDRYILSVVILLYLIYPTLCKSSFRIFTCVEIGHGKWYLSQDLEVECYQGSHLNMVLFVGVPTLLLYVIGLPFMAFVIMYKKHSVRNSHHVKYRYGILYSGFRKKRLYWECIIAVRKVSISAVTVLVSEFGVDMQIHVALLVLMISLTLHLVSNPFMPQWRILELYEATSLIICWLTMWSGIVFHNDDQLNISTNGSMVVMTSAFIVVINSSFMIFMILSIVHQRLHETQNTTRCQNIFICKSILQCIQRCTPLVDRRTATSGMARSSIRSSSRNDMSSLATLGTLDHDTPIVKSRRKLPTEWKTGRTSMAFFGKDETNENPLYEKRGK